MPAERGLLVRPVKHALHTQRFTVTDHFTQTDRLTVIDKYNAISSDHNMLAVGCQHNSGSVTEWGSEWSVTNWVQTPSSVWKLRKASQ